METDIVKLPANDTLDTVVEKKTIHKVGRVSEEAFGVIFYT